MRVRGSHAIVLSSSLCSLSSFLAWRHLPIRTTNTLLTADSDYVHIINVRNRDGKQHRERFRDGVEESSGTRGCPVELGVCLYQV